jgi:transcriptional regulator with XRE-family HTH domain
MEEVHIIVGANKDASSELAAQLTRLRVSLGWSRPQAATNLGVSTEYVRLIETASQSPSMGIVMKMLKMYGVEFKAEHRYIRFEHFAVEFTSRILNARTPKGVAPIPQLSDPDRNTWVGRIVQLLVAADDDTVREVYWQLIKHKGG